MVSSRHSSLTGRVGCGRGCELRTHRAPIGWKCALSCVLGVSAPPSCAARGEPPTSGHEDAARVAVRLLPPCRMRRLRRAAPTVPPDVSAASAAQQRPGKLVAQTLAGCRRCSFHSSAPNGNFAHSPRADGT